MASFAGMGRLWRFQPSTCENHYENETGPNMEVLRATVLRACTENDRTVSLITAAPSLPFSQAQRSTKTTPNHRRTLQPQSCCPAVHFNRVRRRLLSKQHAIWDGLSGLHASSSPDLARLSSSAGTAPQYAKEDEDTTARASGDKNAPTSQPLGWQQHTPCPGQEAFTDSRPTGHTSTCPKARGKIPRSHGDKHACPTVLTQTQPSRDQSLQVNQPCQAVGAQVLAVVKSNLASPHQASGAVGR